MQWLDHFPRFSFLLDGWMHVLRPQKNSEKKTRPKCRTQKITMNQRCSSGFTE